MCSKVTGDLCITDGMRRPWYFRILDFLDWELPASLEHKRPKYQIPRDPHNDRERVEKLIQALEAWTVRIRDLEDEWMKLYEGVEFIAHHAKDWAKSTMKELDEEYAFATKEVTHLTPFPACVFKSEIYDQLLASGKSLQSLMCEGTKHYKRFADDNKRRLSGCPLVKDKCSKSKLKVKAQEAVLDVEHMIDQSNEKLRQFADEKAEEVRRFALERAQEIENAKAKMSARASKAKDDACKQQ